jgi:Rhodopirellula transposase DDE domain
MASAGVKRWRIDGKATGKSGEFSRGGRTRGENRARAHEMGCEEQSVPCGIVDEESGEWALPWGSSYTTSDVIVDVIDAKWEAMAEQEQTETSLIQIKRDNGPERSGRRTPLLSRMGQRADVINKPMPLLY